MFNSDRTATLLLLVLLWAAPARGQIIGTAPSNGVTIQYTRFGEGPPLLLINGGPGLASTHFHPVAHTLSERHQVILFDQRGTGSSPLTSLNSETINLAAMVADIEALRTHLGFDAWTVMGHSFGGMLAMAYAAEHPNRVDQLILSASGGMDLSFLQSFSENLRVRLTPEEREVLDRLSSQEHQADDPAAARRERVRAMAPAYVYDRMHIPAVVEALTETSTYSAQVNALVWADLRRIGYDLHAPLRRFEAPVLILQGEQDLLDVAVARDLYDTFPNAHLVLFDRCSHYLWLDRPEAFYAAILTFLERTL